MKAAAGQAAGEEAGKLPATGGAKTSREVGGVGASQPKAGHRRRRESNAIRYPVMDRDDGILWQHYRYAKEVLISVLPGCSDRQERQQQMRGGKSTEAPRILTNKKMTTEAGSSVIEHK